MIYSIKTQELTAEGLACSKECKEVLSRLSRSKEGIALVEKDMAYLALKYGFKELEYRNFTKNMPMALIEYNSLPFKDRKVETSFWSRPDIAEYMKAKKDYDAAMYSNRHWLKQLKKIFQDHSDFESGAKCDVLITEYEQRLK